MKQSIWMSVAVFSAIAFPQAAVAQEDVRVFSTSDAEEVLADQDEQCPVRLENGDCARTSKTRGFSFAPPKKESSSKATYSSGSTEITKSRPTRRTTAKSTATSRVAAPREVPLQFALGSYVLSPQSKANLANLATVLNSDQHKMKRIRITGHTDKSGSLEINQELSKKRADAAADYLASVGVERDRIEAVGRAYEEILPGLSAYNPRNRRVEVERIE